MASTAASSGPSLTLLGPADLSVVENFPGVGHTLTLDFGISDPFTFADNMQLKATSPYGQLEVGAIVEDPGTPTQGTDTVTFLPESYWAGPVPITLTLTDGAGASVTQTITADILPVDPGPGFVEQVGPITMREGPDASTKGSIGYPVYVYVDALTPFGVDDSGSVVITATSSDTTLIANSDIVVSPIAGVPSAHTLALYSEPGQYGSANVTLTASDGTLTTSQVVAVTVDEVAIAPTITAPASVSYKESSVSQTVSVPITVTDPNAPPQVTVTDPNAPAGWSAPTLTQGAGGHDTVQFVVAPYTYASGSVSLVASSFQGFDVGTASSFLTLPVTGLQEHLDFTVPATQAFSIPEGDGGAVLFGFGYVPVTGDTGDSFSFAILSGDPPVSPTDSTPLYSISNTGVLYANGEPPWSATASNKHIMAVQVSNGVFKHTDVVTVTITDNSPPVLSLAETAATKSAPPHAKITPGVVTVTAFDPHDLALHFAITSQTDASGAKPYFIAGVTKTGSVYTAKIAVAPNAPISGVADTLTVSATDQQGLVSVQTISFFPDIIDKLTAGGTTLPDATTLPHQAAAWRDTLHADIASSWSPGTHPHSIA